VLNVEAQGNECFKYAIVASLHHEEIEDQHNKSRRNFYDRFFQRYDFSTVHFPATADEIVNLMKVNKEIAVNALLYKKNKNNEYVITPIYHPPHSEMTGRRMATILLVDDHWLAVTNLDRLLATVQGHSAHCYRCLRNFHNAELLEKHMAKCYDEMGQKPTMPIGDEALNKFQDWSKMLSPPFVVMRT
jgi:hypothetical protein